MKYKTYEYKKVDLTYIKIANNRLILEQKLEGSQEKVFSFL